MQVAFSHSFELGGLQMCNYDITSYGFLQCSNPQLLFVGFANADLLSCQSDMHFHTWADEDGNCFMHNAGKHSWTDCK